MLKNKKEFKTPNVSFFLYFKGNKIILLLKKVKRLIYAYIIWKWQLNHGEEIVLLSIHASKVLWLKNKFIIILF
jgi:hypothetical protein